MSKVDKQSVIDCSVLNNFHDISTVHVIKNQLVTEVESEIIFCYLNVLSLLYL